MSYEAPINILQLAQDRFRIEIEENAVKAVAAYDIDVNRKELIKALNYDREQYQKGYEDGKAEAMQWIPCSERLPKCNGCYLVWRPHFFGGEIGMPAICYFDGQDAWHDSYGVDFTRILNEKDVIAWMPLPEPYEEGE